MASVAWIGGCAGGRVDRVSLTLRDGRELHYGGGGGIMQEPLLLAPDEHLTKVEHWDLPPGGTGASAFRGTAFRFTTSTNRVYVLAGGDWRRDSPPDWTREAPVGHSITELVWSNSDAAARHAVCTGVRVLPRFVQQVRARIGGAIDMVQLCMTDRSQFSHGCHDNGSPVEPVQINVASGERLVGVRWWRGTHRGRFLELDVVHGTDKRVVTIGPSPRPAHDPDFEAACAAGDAVVGMHWSVLHAGAQHADLSGVDTARWDQDAATRSLGQEGDAIARRGLTLMAGGRRPALESFALGKVTTLLARVHACDEAAAERFISMDHSQVYTVRSAERAHHGHADHPFSPPTSGCGAHGFQAIGVVKIGLRHPRRDIFGADFLVAYHGTPAGTFDAWKAAGAGAGAAAAAGAAAGAGADEDVGRVPLSLAKPSSGDFDIGTAHGEGVYLSPSFQMCLGYALRRFDTPPRRGGANYGITRDGQFVYAVVLMCRVHKGDKESHGGTFMAEHDDGWGRDGIEWVVRDGHNVHVYGVLFAFAHVGARFGPPPHVALVADADVTVGEPCTREWGPGVYGAERTARNREMNGDLFVVRADDGALRGCQFCADHVPEHMASAGGTVAVAFSKDDGDVGDFGKRIIALPCRHIHGVASRAFWDTRQASLLMVLDALRTAARHAVERTLRHELGGAEPDPPLRDAVPVLESGVHVYDSRLLRKHDVIYVFHTKVSREHLHLHALLCMSDGGDDLVRADKARFSYAPDDAPDYVNELGRPGSYSITWHEVFTLASGTRRPGSCAWRGCRCTSRMSGWNRTVWTGAVPPSATSDAGVANSLFCSQACRDLSEDYTRRKDRTPAADLPAADKDPCSFPGLHV